METAAASPFCKTYVDAGHAVVICTSTQPTIDRAESLKALYRRPRSAKPVNLYPPSARSDRDRIIQTWVLANGTIRMLQAISTIPP